MNAAIEVITIVLLGLGAALADGAYHEQRSGPRNWLFFSAYLCFTLAVLVPLAFFGIHPLFARLNTWRAGFLARMRTRRAELRHHEQPPEAPETPPPAPAEPSDLVIHSAWYRPSDLSSQGKDVTETVRSKIVNGSLDMVVSNTELGGDPAENHVKELCVDWSAYHRRSSVTIGEENSLTLP